MTRRPVSGVLLAFILVLGFASSAASSTDVVVMRWGTYLGGPSSESTSAVGVDDSGRVSVGGYTFGGGFPTTPDAVEEGPSGFADAVTATLGAEGTELTYGSYLGGNSQDAVHDLVTDGSGAVYLVGETHSADFPSTAGAVQPASAGGQDAFVAKMGPGGAGLLWATYLGGESPDIALGADVGPDGSLYVTGRTTSDDFPTTPDAVRRSLLGRSDAFVARISPDGARLEYGTLFGGSNTDARPSSGEAGRAIAVDGAGAVYLAGVTDSRDLPTRAQLPPTGRPLNVVYGGGFGDAFAAKLVPGEQQPSWSGYLGGAGSDTASAIAVDDDGRVHVAGGTDSPDFPVYMAAQPFHGGLGLYDGWVAHIQPGGAGMSWSTFLGGKGNEGITDLARNDDGSLWLSGHTSSGNLPITEDALQASYGGGGGDGFLARMEGGGSLRYATFLGGSGRDALLGLARVEDDIVLATGSTDSVNFPVPSDALQGENAGGVDAFVVSVGPPLPEPPCRPRGRPDERPPIGPPPGRPC